MHSMFWIHSQKEDCPMQFYRSDRWFSHSTHRKRQTLLVIFLNNALRYFPNYFLQMFYCDLVEIIEKIVEKISISNVIMAFFLEGAKIKIFFCNSIFSLVKSAFSKTKNWSRKSITCNGIVVTSLWPSDSVVTL